MSVVIETTLGDITVDLYLDQRPVTCLNFLKLCKMKYYNFNLFHSIRSGFIAQTGDPTADGYGGESIFGLLEGPEKRFFSGEKLPKIRHTNTGSLSMVCSGDMLVGSQFFFTLAPDLDSLDDVHCVIGEVTEGHEVLRMLNDVICDESHRPYRDVRITHTVILEDPFNDPPGMQAPSRSPSPSAERLKGGRIAPDEDIDEGQGKSAQEIQEMIEEKEAKARATILEIVGDLPDADIAPPENVLFVCKLNPVTTDEDLEIIFSRFGKIVGCEVIRDRKSGDSLQYAFIEFGDKKSCEDAYFKMDNVLIDDRRIHVDFSQSVSRMRWMGKGKGIKYFNNNGPKDEFGQDKLPKNSNYKDKEKGDDNGRINDDRKQRHGSRDRNHHSDRKHGESREREHHSDRKDRGSRHEKSEKHDRHARSDRDRSRRDRSRSRTDTDRQRSKRGRSRSVEKSERDKIKRSEKTERDRSRKDRSRSRDKRRQRDDKSNKSSRNERHRDKESSRSKKGRSQSKDRSRSRSRERSRRYDVSKKKSRKDRSQSREESRHKEKPAKLSDKDQYRKDHEGSSTHRHTDDRSRSRDRLTDNKESSTARDRLRKDSKGSLNESIGEDYKSDNILNKNETRIDRSRSKEKTNHHENNVEEKSHTKYITDEPTSHSEKCVLDEKSKIHQESDSASYRDGKEEQSREDCSEEFKSSNTVSNTYWSQISTEPMKGSEQTIKHKSISPNHNERSKSHKINHEAPVENHKNSTEDNTFEGQNKRLMCQNSDVLSNMQDEAMQIIMHKQSEKNISDTQMQQHPKDEQIKSNHGDNNEKSVADNKDEKQDEHSKISVAHKKTKHSVKDKSNKSYKQKDPHSPTPVLDKKGRNKKVENKKVDNKKKKIKVLKKKRKQSTSSSSSSSDTSTTSDSSSSEDERKKKSVKRRKRKVSSSTSSSSSSATSSSSTSESSSSSSSDSEPRKKKRKKVVHTKVVKSKKTKKKL